MCLPATDLGTLDEPVPALHLDIATRALLRAADAAAAALLAAAAARVSAKEAFSRAMDASRLEWRDSRGCCARLQDMFADIKQFRQHSDFPDHSSSASVTAQTAPPACCASTLPATAEPAHCCCESSRCPAALEPTVTHLICLCITSSSIASTTCTAAAATSRLASSTTASRAVFIGDLGLRGLSGLQVRAGLWLRRGLAQDLAGLHAAGVAGVSPSSRRASFSRQ